MEKIIPDGTEVLIFNYIPNWGPKQDEERFIRGVIESSELLEEETMHGTPWTMRFYKVIGEDDDVYYGTYDKGIKGSHYFRTVPDHINKIRQKIENNCEEINKLNSNNYRLYELMKELYYNDTKKETEDTEFKSLEEKTTYLAKKNAEKYRKPSFNIFATPCDKPVVITKEMAQSILAGQDEVLSIRENAKTFRKNNLYTKKK